MPSPEYEHCVWVVISDGWNDNEPDGRDVWFFRKERNADARERWCLEHDAPLYDDYDVYKALIIVSETKRDTMFMEALDHFEAICEWTTRQEAIDCRR